MFKTSCYKNHIPETTFLSFFFLFFKSINDHHTTLQTFFLKIEGGLTKSTFMNDVVRNDDKWHFLRKYT